MGKPASDLFKTIRRIQIETDHLANDVLAGAYHSAFKGRGIEFEEVRAYQPGDEVRTIDWNITARMNHPFVKLFKEERELTVMLVVDVSSSCRFGRQRKLKSELLAEVGALLAFSAVKNNDKVGLLLFSDIVEKYIPPRKGLRHVLRIIRDLLYFTPQRSLTDIGHALAFVSKIHRHSSICFVLSDFQCAPFDHAWTLLAQRHDLIAMQVTDPYEQNFPAIGLASLQDLETGRTALIDTSSKALKNALHEETAARQERLKKLCNKVGSGLIELSTENPPLAAIKRFFRLRSRRCH